MNKMDKLLVTQAKLFEHTHSNSTELKPLGFKVKNEGIDTSKYYCNPKFMLLPFDHCETLSSLTEEQMSVLTATYYAMTYAEIASSETLTLKYNLLVTNKIFETYSDEYMILFHETAEEIDHIITFHNVCKGLLGTGHLMGPQNFERLKPVSESFSKFESKLCSYGFGAMFLLMRYLLNLALKQLESFMSTNIAKEKIHTTTQSIIKGHSDDEARHTTTSLQLGFEFFKRADKYSQSFIRSMLKHSIYTMIEMRFSAVGDQYQYSVAKKVLDSALQHSCFEGFGMTADDLEGRWKRQKIILIADVSYINSQRWIAQQIQILADLIEIKVNPKSDCFEQYHNFLKVA